MLLEVGMHLTSTSLDSSFLALKAKSQTSRSVSYYIHIDKPMRKGDTVELLVNYKVRLLGLPCPIPLLVSSNSNTVVMSLAGTL